MAGVSDQIEQYLKLLLREVQQVHVCRNELAARLGCSPSQINYVLGTRFTPERGYQIESRRGGGGYIRIIRIELEQSSYLSQVLHAWIGEAISDGEARRVIDTLVEKHIVTPREGCMLAAACCGQALCGAMEERNAQRAQTLKRMLLAAEGA